VGTLWSPSSTVTASPILAILVADVDGVKLLSVVFPAAPVPSATLTSDDGDVLLSVVFPRAFELVLVRERWEGGGGGRGEGGERSRGTTLE
jgi:hypothetical protein